MFEQTSRLAEKVASSVSRRGFLGSLGSWAAAAALGVAGVLTGTGTARATDRDNFVCCFYAGPSGCGGVTLAHHCKQCPSFLNGCPFHCCGAYTQGCNGC